MNEIIIFFYIIGIFISIAFWEAYIEGSGGWAANQVGWRLNFKVGFLKRPLDAYHFWSWLVMLPMFLMLPFVMFGWNEHLFWVTIASALIGVVVEDYLWFVVNPKFRLEDFKPSRVWWHYWIGYGKYKVPELYIVYPILAILIFIFLV